MYCHPELYADYLLNHRLVVSVKRDCWGVVQRHRDDDRWNSTVFIHADLRDAANRLIAVKRRYTIWNTDKRWRFFIHNRCN